MVSPNFYDLGSIEQVFEECRKLNAGVYVVGSVFQWGSENQTLFLGGLVYNNVTGSTENIIDVLTRHAKANGLNFDTSDPDKIIFVAYP
jgi:hypothetical protein